MSKVAESRRVRSFIDPWSGHQGGSCAGRNGEGGGSRPSGCSCVVARGRWREHVAMAANEKSRRRDVIHERPREDWHALLDELTRVRSGDDVTIELLDAEF